MRRWKILHLKSNSKIKNKTNKKILLSTSREDSNHTCLTTYLFELTMPSGPYKVKQGISLLDVVSVALDEVDALVARSTMFSGCEWYFVIAKPSMNIMIHRVQFIIF